jgi:hypothetical protein
MAFHPQKSHPIKDSAFRHHRAVGAAQIFFDGEHFLSDVAALTALHHPGKIHIEDIHLRG